ncbi:nitrite reductase, copper-containing [Pseudorhizobium endolithicum]|uniref:Copper-containing nitrite reductase n=1 Tax=Pseudorhizobium endolithicum TaxID=1191678 RepID=A0ABN7K0E2_9HYPH|nr:copper-containing nitrite reductase [Pseudorhizobium endolithicum]CAD7052411.1 nitrite reductase, copper-containing [Pseudorhizobium endolithicum]
MTDSRTVTQENRDEGERIAVSRRALLAGSAGLALGTLGAAQEAAAQHGHGGTSGAVHAASHSNAVGSLSQRAYSVPTPVSNDIAHDPSAVPPPIGRREPETIRVDLETREVEAKLDQRATFRYWTFNGTVPGPMVRVRVGDTVEVHLKNAEDSWMMHNVDFHAVTGPGGGAEATNCAPGEEKAFKFKARHPGLYVYHCAVPPVAMHMANGMYGMILVEPEDGLPPVDREFYVMQGEIYTAEPFGSEGLLTEDYDKLLNERPEYFVLNGHVGALTDHYPMKASVGETIRIFFGVGGPNHVSSFHVIGEIFDRVYINGSVTQPPQTDVQTVVVPAGGAAIVEFQPEVPGRYVLVDHSLSRVERGLAGWLDVEGEENPEVFSEIG